MQEDKPRGTCRSCRAPIEAFMSFGRMPIANRFLDRDSFADEYFFTLAPAFCSACSTFQIVEQPAPDEMFHDSYTFFTRTSRGMVAHFGNYADWVYNTYLDGPDPFVVEIGSNDGAMLENFVRKGIRHMGVEPSGNTAEVARSHGVVTHTAFFNTESTTQIAAENGLADAVIAANVICHIPDLHSVAEGLDQLLKPDGVFVFEEPYLGDMIEKTSYDQIYDEHVFIFSLASVDAIFGRHGFEIVNVLHQETHGGSMRYVLSRRGRRPASDEVAVWRAKETNLGLHLPDTYEDFRKRCERSRNQLVELLEQLRKNGRRVVGYGATSKSTTVTNYCGLTDAQIEFISDTTPDKQGKFSPGAHIPVRPYEDFSAAYPDYALLFAWNHQREIFAKEEAFRAAGGRWILYVPDTTILDT